ncbi:MAG: peroxiredoxin family protein [Elusimicrobiota bacterium]
MKRKIIFGLTILALSAVLNAAFVNDPAPQFSLKDMNGKDVSLKDFQGKDVVLVNFWASWCPPCKEEFPELSELANEYKGHGLQVLAINLDKSQDRVKKFLEKMKINPGAMTILLDPKSEVVANYVARSMPSSFIIDKTGVIRFVHFGFNEKDPVKWREEIDQLLAGEKKK